MLDNGKCNDCNHILSDQQIEDLVEKVIETMTQKAYQEVGRKVVGGLFWIFSSIGVVTFAVYSILKSKGIVS